MVFALLMLLTAAGCATRSRAPANIYPLKQEIRAYVDSGQYGRDLAALAATARGWIEQRVARRAPGERLAVVFDLDETLLSNWPLISVQDFGYVPATWEAWVQEGKAPAIEPVREVYRAVRAAGVDVIFLTGRRERDRAGTEKKSADHRLWRMRGADFQTDRLEGNHGCLQACGAPAAGSRGAHDHREPRRSGERLCRRDGGADVQAAESVLSDGVRNQFGPRGPN